MAYFSTTAAAVLASRVVRCATLVFLDFRDAPYRVWPGFGPLAAGGYTWSGLGELGSIQGLDSALGGTAPETTFTLSGVDPGLIADTLAASDQVKGRGVTVFLQFFADDWTTLDAPYAIYAGTMDVMKVKASRETASITVTAETLFARRAASPWQYLSNTDQIRRFPGDRGLEMVPSMANKSLLWPPAFSS